MTVTAVWAVDKKDSRGRYSTLTSLKRIAHREGCAENGSRKSDRTISTPSSSIRVVDQEVIAFKFVIDVRLPRELCTQG